VSQHNVNIILDSLAVILQQNRYESMIGVLVDNTEVLRGPVQTGWRNLPMRGKRESANACVSSSFREKWTGRGFLSSSSPRTFANEAMLGPDSVTEVTPSALDLLAQTLTRPDADENAR